MKQTITFYEFRDAFRSRRPNNFSVEGLSLLFDYLEQLEQDMGEEIEFDVVAICCDFSEDTPDDIASNYSIDLSDCESDEQKVEIVTEWLQDNTTLVGVTEQGTIVYNSAF